MSAAWDVEALKLRRSPVARTSALALVVGTCVLAAGFTAVGLGDGDSQMAVKVRPMLQGTGWSAYLGMLAQILSVGTLLAVGIVLTWSVGREFTDGTVAGLQALPTPTASIAGAKLATVALGAGACALATVGLAIPLGLAIGLGPPDGDAARAAGQALVVALLMTLLTAPLAWVASVRRGYLPGVGALLGIVVATQVATVAGAGAWMPWAAPGLWVGMGGPAAAAAVTPAQLLLALPVGAVGALGTVRWWSTAELC
ncbi:ABC transporter permease [Cellulomonas sp. S1-8]|uniref:ABC transporter permease n=1 Tax=Cellulomonas sp. S1-8 TaxID=2904790 RepID=UPI002242DB94|nr:ABC transporter permease [Cellulomonas sp. S1-8]UZN05138.1 ABC transporter permease [Cellulomonas sp. S1-8]